jgi:hypothetical protein
MNEIHAREAVSTPEPDDFNPIEDRASRIAEYAENGTGYNGRFENTSEMNEVIEKLEEKGFRPTQRPRKLPALMIYWDNLLKESGHPVTWFSKRVKGRRTVVRAVAGSYFVDDELEHWIILFGDIMTAEYEKNH